MPDELSIGEVGERVGMAPSALRFYEDRGLITSTRDAGGRRRYRRDVLRRLAVIRIAQRLGMTLDEIESVMASLPNEAAPTARQWDRMATRWRPMLDERIRMLEGLRDDLDSCIGCGCLSLSMCRLYNPDDGAAALGTGARYLLGDSSADVTS